MTDIVKKFATQGRSPFMEGLGIAVVLNGDAPVVEVGIEDKHLRSHNIAHGGVICTVLDTAMGAAAYQALLNKQDDEDGSRTELVTSNLTINFIRPAWNGESIIGRGHVIHHGRKTIVVRGEVETTTGETIAAGSGTFMPVSIPTTPDDNQPTT